MDNILSFSKQVQLIDWIIIAVVLLISILIGIVTSKKASRNLTGFFLADRNMSWWLLGFSMVATAFSIDTPNLVTQFVREDGISGNWQWWAFLPTGMLTVFLFSKLWRRAKIMTDIEFYELRYSGKSAIFLRGFRSIYLGVVFNILVMSGITLATIKFGEIVLGLPGWITILITASVTIIYSNLGGLKAIILADFVQFIIAIVGSVAACIFILYSDDLDIGGLSGLLEYFRENEEVKDKINIIPNLNSENLIALFIIPLAVQWWASYYPGSEPGGGNYIAQRMFSAKNEKHTVGATFLFNVCHYVIRPWPWILIALASLVLFPTLAEVEDHFTEFPRGKLGNDMAYPLMLTFLPSGLLGLVAASLVAAFMSTMSTQINMGAAYVVNDFYKRLINPKCHERRAVYVGKIISVISIFLGCLMGFAFENARQIFDLILLIGAGNGLIYMLRWFWWRINAKTEIITMFLSIVIAIFVTFIYPQFASPEKKLDRSLILATSVLLNTTVSLISCFFIGKTDQATLFLFYQKIKPFALGWKKVIQQANNFNIRLEKYREGNTQFIFSVFSSFLGCIFIYSALLGTGFFILGKYFSGIICMVLLLTAFAILKKAVKKIKFE